MAHWVLLVTLALSSPTQSAGTASLTGQCVEGPDGSCRGRGVDSSALLQGRMRVDDDALPDSDAEVTENFLLAMTQQKDSREAWGVWAPITAAKVQQAVTTIRENAKEAVKKDTAIAVKDALKQEVKKAIKGKSDALVGAIKAEAKRVKAAVKFGHFRSIANFTNHCKDVWDKACACANLDPQRNCQRMKNRECDGNEVVTASKCWGFIEVCAFAWNRQNKGNVGAALQATCAGECRVQFGFETMKYVQKCSASMVKTVKQGIKTIQDDPGAMMKKVSHEATGMVPSKKKRKKSGGGGEEEEEDKEEEGEEGEEEGDLLEAEEEDALKTTALDEALATKKSC